MTVVNKGPTLGMRHMQTLLLFLNIVVLYISRLNIGVAVVAMTNAATTNPNFPEFDWSEKEISYILSSFYWGYVVTQFPGGALCKRFGAKITMGFSTFISAVLGALTPWCVVWGGWKALCVIRLVQGLFQGFIYPCIHQHLAKWAPLEERSRLGALSHTGFECGTVMAMFLSGFIAEGPLGWPGLSYVSAGLCFVWCLLWWIFSSNNATESRFITEAEKVYIESSLEHSEDFHKKKIPVPWKAILTSVPFSALLVAYSSYAWSIGTLQAQMPSYFNGVLNLDIKSNGLFSSLPFLAQWAMSYIYVLIADIILRKKLMSLTVLRKSFNTVAYWIPAAGLIAIGFLDENNKTLALVLMTISVGVSSGATIGSCLNTIDLSANHAGIITGITNCIANFMPLIAPLVVGVIVTDTSNRSEWQIVFIISSIIFFFGPTLGMRHMQTLLLFLNIVVLYISRLNIGVAVVAMTNAATTNPNFPEFDWSEKEISYILSSFYWGYVVTQFPGGALCKRFGAKITMGFSTFISAVLGALTPWCVVWGGWKALCVIRLVQGLFQGFIYPCIHQHLAKWAPLEERSRLGALSHTGFECGTVMAMFLSGFIAEGPLGWPGLSYVSAGLCFVWCLLWWIFSSNNATESRFITEAEKVYIESSLEHSEDFHKKKIPVPWKAILTSVPFSALLVAYSSYAWSIGTLQAQMPSYFNGVLNLDIKSNGLFSSLPFLAQWAMSYIYVLIADIILRKKLMSLTVLRKSFNTVAYWIPAAGLIAIGFLDENNKTLALVLMTISVGVSSGATIGSCLNTIDLSANHAGIITGITNCIANFMPLIAPLVVGVIVTDTSNRSEWQIVFIISSIIFFFGNLYYLFFGTAKSQPWDAEDFLIPKDSESSTKVRNDSQLSADASEGMTDDSSKLQIKKYAKNR